jgi:hypothetical protein
MAYELLESGGLPESRLGMEILYLLPDAFVEFYQTLFHQALQVRDSSVMGGGGKEGLERAAGATGMVTGSDTKLQAMGSGKKWRNTPLSIGNEISLKVKEKLDSGLLELVGDARRDYARLLGLKVRGALTAGGDEDGSGSGPTAADVNQAISSALRKCKGSITTGYDSIGGTLIAQERKCGRFLKAGWQHCPTCGTRVGITEEQSG